MIRPLLKFISFLFFTAAISLQGWCQPVPQLMWRLARQSDVKGNPAEICNPGYTAGNWINAVVPGTAFYAYVKAGREKNPDYADNIYKVDKSHYNQPYWYRSEFSGFNAGVNKRLWLKFNGINKRAEVYFNGRHIGTIKGLMERGVYDITDMLKPHAKNVIAVQIVPPRWDPEHNHPLANWESPTYICSGSWDWMPAVPGLNSGITDSVTLTITGPVRLSDPWLRAELPNNQLAKVSVSAMLTNASAVPVTGKVKAVIEPGHITVTGPEISIAAKSTKAVSFKPEDFPQLVIKNPKLWWPNGYGGNADGTQHLYQCRISFNGGGQTTDQVSSNFGIRRISADTTSLNGPMRLYVNGVPILLKGGNWGMADYMLKVRGRDYETRIKLHKAMNFNMIRNWTGEVTDDDFYKYCDKYGIMVWDDFWLNNIGGVDSLEMFKDNAIEKVKKLRNHPAVVIWCGANEGVPGSNPHGSISNAILSAIHNNDEDDRLYLPRSNAGVNNPNFSSHGGSKNLSGSGIWANVDPKTYFTDPHNGYLFSAGSWGLRSELGTATFVNPESFKRFMPKEFWVAPTPGMVNSKDNLWARHFFSTDFALGGGADPVRYIKDIDQRYGKATSLEDFCKKAQLMNVETMKAMFESWNDHLWNDASGMLIWMSQSAYPTMIWQTYDYYYDLTGAYFGAKSACEPVHIQWNPATDMVKVINNRPYPVSGLTAEAEVYNMDGKVVPFYSKRAAVNIQSTSLTEVFKVLDDTASRTKLSSVYFLKLKLYNATHAVISENLYLMGKNYLDYNALGKLPSVKNDLKVSAAAGKTDADGIRHIAYNLTNNSAKSAAVGIRVQLLNNKGEQILPAIFDDSYFTLMQGERKTIHADVAAALLKQGYRISVEPYNP